MCGAHLTQTSTALRVGPPFKDRSKVMNERVAYQILFCGGIMDGHRSRQVNLPVYIEIVTEDEWGDHSQVRYRQAGLLDEEQLAIYEIDTGLH